MARDEWESGVGFDDPRHDDGRWRAALRRIVGGGESPLTWGVTIWRSRSLSVRVHLVFVLFIALELIYSLPKDGLGLAFRLWLLLGLLVSVLVHEIARVVACNRLGGESHDILMWPLGGLDEGAPSTRWPQSLLTTLAGSGATIGLAVPLGAVVRWLTGAWDAVVFNPFDPAGVLAELRLPASVEGGVATQPWWLTALWSAHYANLLVIGLNLIVPTLPLDAGRVVRDIAARRVGRDRAGELAAGVGLGGALVLGVFAVVFNEVALLGVGAFGAWFCYLELRRARFIALGGEDPLSRPDEDRERDRRLRDEAAARDERAEIDRILAKISEGGMDALTGAERRTLKRATRQGRDT